MSNRLSISRSEIAVRKHLPTHLVAQRIHASRKSYNRARDKRGAFAGW